MGLRFVILTFLFFPCLSLAGFSCEMSKALQEASGSGKLGDDFWQEYAQLSQKGIGDRELNTLLQKHGAGMPAATNMGRRATDIIDTPRIRPQVEKTALKDIDRLTPSLRQKYAEVVEQLTLDPTGKSFYSQPGRWNFERIKQFGPNAHSVRLDGGYRVLFDLKDGVATIRNVSKTMTH